MNYAKTKEHLHLLDYIRCVLYLAIASFHFVSIVWIDKGYAFSDVSFLWAATEQYARTFVYSGQIILCLTFALMAFREDSVPKLKRIALGSFFGAVLMAVADYPDNQSLFIWDIYPLVFTGAITLIFFIKLGEKWLYSMAVLGLLLLQVSFWELPLYISSVELRAALIGDCVNKYADWPLLPWIGLIWFSFGLGRLAFANREKLKVMHKAEMPIVIVIFLLGIFYFNSYRQTPTNVEWACFVFRRPPLVFLSQLFLYVVLFRFALLKFVQRSLEKIDFTYTIGNLRFSTNFGLFYLIHYLLMASAFHFAGQAFAESASISFVVFITLPILTELILRIFIRTDKTA